MQSEATFNATVAPVMARDDGQPVQCSMHIYRAAQNARLYRIAARDLRKCAKEDNPSARRADLLAKARRMERNARACERALLAYADALLSDTGDQA